MIVEPGKYNHIIIFIHNRFVMDSSISAMQPSDIAKRLRSRNDFAWPHYLIVGNREGPWSSSGGGGGLKKRSSDMRGDQTYSQVEVS